jgi:hypothetical protein
MQLPGKPEEPGGLRYCPKGITQNPMCKLLHFALCILDLNLLPLLLKVATICVGSKYFNTLILSFLIIWDKQFVNEVCGNLYLITPLYPETSQYYSIQRS